MPGWNSLDFVSKVHSWAEILGIAFLVLLALADVVALIYGHRKDTLAERAERTRAQEAERKLTEVRRQQEQRALTPEQKQTLIAALSPFQGQKTRVVCSLGDVEAHRFAQDFVAVLSIARWSFEPPPPGINQVVSTGDLVGVGVLLNEGETNAGRVPSGAVALVATLTQLGLTEPNTVIAHPQTPVGVVEVRVGRTPPREAEQQEDNN